MSSLPKKLPAWLAKNKRAEKEFKRILPLLADVDANGLDESALFAYLSHYARFQEAEEHLTSGDKIKETPNGHQQADPWIRISRDACDRMHKFQKELLLTPLARKRVNLETSDGREEDDFFEGP